MELTLDDLGADGRPHPRHFRSAVLERPHALGILMALRSGPRSKVALANLISTNFESVARRLRELADANLITERIETTGPRRKVISLTDRGSKVADLIWQIEHEL